MRRRILPLTAVIAALCVAGVAAVALADIDPIGKKDPPSTVPGDVPETGSRPVVEKESLQEQVERAAKVQAQFADDPDVIVCLRPNKTLIGYIALDRPSGARPLSASEKKAACDNGFTAAEKAEQQP
jgi:hypothetical protein